MPPPAADASTKPWSQAILLCVVITAVTGIYSSACGTGMLWDGSYQFCDTLILQRPYVYLWRFHSAVLWQPTVWASRLTDNVAVLRFLFGLPFLLAPAAALALSWWIVRPHSLELMLWAALGIAVAPLPGQIFVINDSIFQQHLFWPIFMAMIVPAKLRLSQAVVLLALGIFQFSHQIGAVLLLGGAVAAGAMAVRFADHRGRFLTRALIALIAAGLAALKIVAFPDPYAAREFSWRSAAERWSAGVQGWPIRGMVCFYAAAAIVFASPWLRRDGGRRLANGGALFLALVGGGTWMYWASDVGRWAYASEFRRWLTPLTVPFFALALFEAMRGVHAAQPRRRDQRVRQLAMVVAAGVFAVVISMQSAQYARLARQFDRQIATDARPTIPAADFAWTRRTPLQHWSLPALAIARQSKTPAHFIVSRESDRAQLLSNPPTVPLAAGETRPASPGAAGWFDFRPLAARAAISQ